MKYNDLDAGQYVKELGKGESHIETLNGAVIRCKVAGLMLVDFYRTSFGLAKDKSVASFVNIP